MPRFEPPNRVMDGKYRALALAAGTQTCSEAHGGYCGHPMRNDPTSRVQHCIFRQGYFLDKIRDCPLALGYYWSTPDRVE